MLHLFRKLPGPRHQESRSSQWMTSQLRLVHHHISHHQLLYLGHRQPANEPTLSSIESWIATIECKPRHSPPPAIQTSCQRTPRALQPQGALGIQTLIPLYPQAQKWHLLSSIPTYLPRPSVNTSHQELAFSPLREESRMWQMRQRVHLEYGTAMRMISMTIWILARVHPRLCSSMCHSTAFLKHQVREALAIIGWRRKSATNVHAC